jgi:hypothetical protein
MIILLEDKMLIKCNDISFDQDDDELHVRENRFNLDLLSES